MWLGEGDIEPKSGGPTVLSQPSPKTGVKL
jgi:hypothetical protein